MTSRTSALLLPLLKPLPVLVLLAAALDSASVHRAQDHREAEAQLFMQSTLIWLVFGLLALLPAWPTLAGVRRWAQIERGAATPWALGAGTLAAWLAFPVFAHGRLDRLTSIGQDVSALLQPWPWIQVAAIAVGMLALVRYLGPLLSRLPSRLCAGLALILALPIGMGVLASERVTEEPVQAKAPAGAPNLLLLVWDTTRAQSLSTYGYARETTPFMAQFSQQCLQFEESRSVSCFTLTSHLSMLTGVYPSQHGASLTSMSYDPQATPTIARLLHDAGYRTGGFVGTGVLRAGTGMVDGFEVYDDRVDPTVCDTRAWSLVHDVQAILAKALPALANNGLPHWFQDFQRPAGEVLTRALDWIQEEDERPWFCFVNLYDVHWPYLPGAAGRQLFVDPHQYKGDVDGYLFRSDQYSRPPGVKRGSQLKQADRTHLRDLYDGEMFELDTLVGTFVNALNLRDGGTAVLLTSDHGESFGEAGCYEHDDITEPQVRVPLLIYPPMDATLDRPRGEQVQGRTSGVDVARTLLGFAGVVAPKHMRGIDLGAEAPGEDRAILIEDRDKMRLEDMHIAIYRGNFKLVQTGLGKDARLDLYDLRSDAVGMFDVGPQHPEVVKDMAAEMLALRKEWGGDQEQFRAEANLGHAVSGLGYGDDGAPDDE